MCGKTLSWSLVLSTLVFGTASCAASTEQLATAGDPPIQLITTQNDLTDESTRKPAFVRVVHASPDSLQSEQVALAFDDSAALFKRGLTYLDVQRYVQVPLGEHLLFIHNDLDESLAGQLLRSPVMKFEPGHFYSILLIGRPAEQPAFDARVVEDDSTPVSGARSRIKFLHATSGASGFDLCSTTTPGGVGTPVFANVQYGAWGTSESGSQGEVDIVSESGLDLQLRTIHPSHRPCAGNVLAELRFSLSVPAHLTAVSVGREGSRGSPVQLLLCAGAPSQTVCARSRLRR